MNSTLTRESFRPRGTAVGSSTGTPSAAVPHVAPPTAVAARHIDVAVPKVAAGAPEPGGSLGKFRRMAAVIAGAVAFLGIASLIKPDPRSASAYENGATPIHPAARAPNINGRSMQGDSHDILVALSMQAHPQGWRLIGSLEGTEHLVLVYSSPNGPRYSVFTLQGRLVAGGLEAGEVYRVVPELDMTTLRDLPESDGKPLMLVTPQD